MDADRIKKFRNRVTFISGSAKNAGKTTFLNYLLPRLRGEGEFAFMTIGIDGERKDQIFGTDKPVIETFTGDYLITCESLMNKSDASFRILQVFPWKTVLGRLLFLRTVRSGQIELAGPENNDQLGRIIKHIQMSTQIGTILIDGAVNRITQISASKNSSFYFVSKISGENRTSSLDKLKVLSKLNEQKNAELIADKSKTYYHKGALTGRDLPVLDRSFKSIVLEDFTKVFLGFSELEKLLNEFSLYFLNTLDLEAFVFNLYNINESEFADDLLAAGIKTHCIFNPYIKN